MRWKPLAKATIRQRVLLVRCLIIPIGAACLLWDLLRGTWHWLSEFPDCVYEAMYDNLNTIRLVFSKDLIKYTVAHLEGLLAEELATRDRMAQANRKLEAELEGYRKGRECHAYIIAGDDAPLVSMLCDKYKASGTMEDQVAMWAELYRLGVKGTGTAGKIVAEGGVIRVFPDGESYNEGRVACWHYHYLPLQPRPGGCKCKK